MNIINKEPIDRLGYGFISNEFLPEGKDEYYLRDLQNPATADYRPLTGPEIEILIKNDNASNNWNEIWVSGEFNPHLIKQCQFYGKIRLGKLEPYYLEFHNLRLPVGLYNSTICSCDIGDNVVIDNVGYLAHYIVGNESILVNVDELTTTDFAKFGNGIIKEGEPEIHRIWLEICNENGGRKVLPFNGMTPGDAWIWSKYRDRAEIMHAFESFTEKILDNKRGYYGTIGEKTVIKNCKIIKDVRIGDHAYIKGANKLKNMTINSTAEAPSQIGEGCEMVNGIMEIGCRAFYGIKAVRFIMASHSNLKYGARLINSYLGNNATVSCCEVLNSLIYPSHEQHHNTSFLIATTILGQSNVAAGATIGSNHNSRGADGELIAGRGFWPGLSVTLKHNSRFASFTLMTKGNYLYEIDLKIPFSLISNDESKNELGIYPAYWFDHNLFALARNTHKFKTRDLRPFPRTPIEYEYLAPDSVQEMADTIKYLSSKINGQEDDILVSGIENSKRITRIRKPQRAIFLFKELISYYLVKSYLEYFNSKKNAKINSIIPHAHSWTNIGGQLITRDQLDNLLSQIENKTINSWDEVHAYYAYCEIFYPLHKLEHALFTFYKINKITVLMSTDWLALIEASMNTSKWINDQTIKSKQKDFTNSFRKMMYESQKEMDEVIGTIDSISFLTQAKMDHENFIIQAAELLNTEKLNRW